MPHPQPRTNNNYIDDDVNSARLGAPPINFIPYNSPDGVSVVNGVVLWEPTCYTTGGGKDGLIEIWLTIPFMQCQGPNGVIAQYNLVDVSGGTTGVAGAYVHQDPFCVYNVQNNVNAGLLTFSGTPSLYTYTLPFGSQAGMVRLSYCSLEPGQYIFTVTSTSCLGVGGSNTPLVWNITLPTQSPCPTHYCTDFNCAQISQIPGSGMTAAQISAMGYPTHANIDDCIACCGGVSTPTYANGTPNPHYEAGTFAHAGYVAWANTNSLPVLSSSTFINYMWEVHGITSCGEVTCGGLANPWPCCDPNQCTGSDIRLKENINKVGVSKSGIPIYTFNYKGENQLWSGTMAQDLLSLGKQDAVTIMSNGYYGVYYDMIDVDMIAV